MPGNLTAYRPEVARAKGLPEPANFTTHTTVRDPKEVFKFSFPDLYGKLVSSRSMALKTRPWLPARQFTAIACQ